MNKSLIIKIIASVLITVSVFFVVDVIQSQTRDTKKQTRKAKKEVKDETKSRTRSKEIKTLGTSNRSIWSKAKKKTKKAANNAAKTVSKAGENSLKAANNATKTALNKFEDVCEDGMELGGDVLDDAIEGIIGNFGDAFLDAMEDAFDDALKANDNLVYNTGQLLKEGTGLKHNKHFKHLRNALKEPKLNDLSEIFEKVIKLYDSREDVEDIFKNLYNNSFQSVVFEASAGTAYFAGVSTSIAAAVDLKSIIDNENFDADNVAIISSGSGSYGPSCGSGIDVALGASYSKPLDMKGWGLSVSASYAFKQGGMAAVNFSLPCTKNDCSASRGCLVDINVPTIGNIHSHFDGFMAGPVEGAGSEVSVGVSRSCLFDFGNGEFHCAFNSNVDNFIKNLLGL